MCVVFQIAILLLACSCLQAQEMKTYLIAQQRQGVIEFLDPVTLATVSQIHFDVPRNSVGLNGVSASSDGTQLYVEGPITDSPNGCCNLFSIDLATLQAKKIADFGGIRSRAAFFLSNGIMYQASEIFAQGNAGKTGDGAAFLDPTRRFLIRLVGFDHPALDLYDLTQGTRVRHLDYPGLNGQWYPTGVWSGDHFFLYAAGYDRSSATQLWTGSTTTAELGPGVAVDPFAQVPGCLHRGGPKGDHCGRREPVCLRKVWN